MAQDSATKKIREKKLVFEKAKFDPLTNPDAFEPKKEPTSISRVNVDSGWEDESKTDTKNIGKDDEEETKYDKIEANIERAKMLKKKKVDFRAEMTSDSNEIDDLLMFQRKKDKNEKEKIKEIDEELLNVGDDDLLKVETKKKSDKKSLEDLLAETDDMFKEIEDKGNDINAELNLNVDDDFNFDQYINQQDAE